MTLDISGVEIKIKRTEKHIEDLRIATSEITGRKYNPYVERGYLDSQTGEYVIAVDSIQHPDSQIGAIAGDAAHNLRSALDLLMFQIDLAPTDKTAFPVCWNAKHFESIMTRMEQDGRYDTRVVTLLKALKPYQGGNLALWRLHRIDITDKHHVLIPAVMIVNGVFLIDSRPIIIPASGSITVRSAAVPNILPDFAKCVIPRTENSAEVLRLPPGTVTPEMHVKPYLSCEIAFVEPQVVEGESMFPCLFLLADYVKGVVQSFVALGL